MHRKVRRLCGFVQKMAKQGEQEECKEGCVLFVREKELLLLCQVG